MARMAKTDVDVIVAECRRSNVPYVIRFQKADGSIRTMLCTGQGPAEFAMGADMEERTTDDEISECVTVFALDVFAQQISDGVPRARAGQNSWRRFKTNSVIRIEPIGL